MANFTRGPKRRAAARKGHRNTTKRKSHRGVRKAARTPHSRKKK